MGGDCEEFSSVCVRLCVGCEHRSGLTISMATESPVLAQLRQQQLAVSPSHGSSSYLVEKPVASDTLSAVQEMALSAVIQQHNTTGHASSSGATPSLHSGGGAIKSYYVQTSGGGIAAMSMSLQNNPVVGVPEASTAGMSPAASLQPVPSSSSPPIIAIPSLAGGSANQFSQGPSVLLGPGAGGGATNVQAQQSGYIALHSPSPSTSGATPPAPGGGMVLAHQQPGPAVIQPQAMPLKLPHLSGQFQESPAPVQITQVAQGRTLQQTTPISAVGNLQQANIVG